MTQILLFSSCGGTTATVIIGTPASNCKQKSVCTTGTFADAFAAADASRGNGAFAIAGAGAGTNNTLVYALAGASVNTNTDNSKAFATAYAGIKKNCVPNGQIIIKIGLDGYNILKKNGLALFDSNGNKIVIKILKTIDPNLIKKINNNCGYPYLNSSYIGSIYMDSNGNIISLINSHSNSVINNLYIKGKCKSCTV
jgi:hypothetical protein